VHATGYWWQLKLLPLPSQWLLAANGGHLSTWKKNVMALCPAVYLAQPVPLIVS